MSAISNSSPLIFYAAVGRIALLQDLYEESSCHRPCGLKWWRLATIEPGSSEVRAAGWIRRVGLPVGAGHEPSLAALDRGEAEAIALTLPRHVPVILDDKPGRRTARKFGLTVTGTGGVLVVAKQQGLVPAIRPLLTEFRTAGLYVSDAAVDRFLDLAGESRERTCRLR